MSHGVRLYLVIQSLTSLIVRRCKGAWGRFCTKGWMASPTASCRGAAAASIDGSSSSSCGGLWRRMQDAHEGTSTLYRLRKLAARLEGMKGDGVEVAGG